MQSGAGEELGAAFRERFDRAPEAGARAPGRVNLIGEHTDYNRGLVLPCAIDRDTWAVGALRSDGRCRVWARDLGEEAAFEVASPRPRGGWIDYVQGVVDALRRRGLRVRGLDLAVASQVPPASGLSSSAALGVAVTTLVDVLQGLGLGALERARVAHAAESGFVGVGCGILDQFASALGRRDQALRIDCRTQEVAPVTMPPGRVALLVVHSGVTRRLAEAGYRERVAECAAALEAARACGGAPPEATSLRDLAPGDLPRLEAALEPVLLQRVRHVVTENARVDAVCAALARGDLAQVGALLREGQASLRDDYAVSTPELDHLCDEADALPGVYGSRLTGAGFGGCTLHLVDPPAAAEVARALAGRFEARFARRPPVWQVRPWDGASAVKL
jgi:galactokinase